MEKKLDVEDIRTPGEKKSLYIGFAVLVGLLLFLAIDYTILAIIAVVGTAIAVWIRQGQLIGQCVRVSNQQFPEIHELAQAAAQRLDMKPPEMFVMQNEALNAFATGFLGRKSVVLHSRTVEAMTEPELQYIIGHEFTHIKCGHTNLGVLTSSQNSVSIPVISQLLNFIFLFWSRKAEYTCDRGGLLASRDLATAISATCKLAVGPELFKRLNLEHFLQQQQDVDQDDIARITENLSTHPYLIKRIRSLREFHEGEMFARLTSDQAPPKKPTLRAIPEETVNCPLCSAAIPIRSIVKGPNTCPSCGKNFEAE